MPIQPRFRSLYPPDWPEISRLVRFVRAGGRCEVCGKPHGHEVRVLRDGRWFDTESHTWRSNRGMPAAWPDVVDYATVRNVRVIIAACPRDHDPRNSDPSNIVALCGAHHLEMDRAEHQRRRRITYLLRRAVGDFFTGTYSYL